MRETVRGIGHEENERKVDGRERIPSVIAVLNDVPRLARACCIQLVSNLHDRVGNVSQMFVFFLFCQFASLAGTAEYEFCRRCLSGYKLSRLGGETVFGASKLIQELLHCCSRTCPTHEAGAKRHEAVRDP